MHSNIDETRLKIVKASAGSGKTHRLTIELLILLFNQPQAYQKVLGVTFTNKATAEMKERVMSVLEDLALERNDSGNQDFIDKLLEAYPQYNFEQLTVKAQEIYALILHDYSRFSISTIDKFVLKVIRGLTHELGINHHFQIELNIDKVLDEITQSLMDVLEEDKELLDWFLQIAIEKLEDGGSWDFRSALYGYAKNILFSDGFNDFEKQFNLLNQPKILEQLHEHYLKTNKAFKEVIASWHKAMYEICNQSGVDPSVLTDPNRNRFRKLWQKENKLDTKDFEKYFDGTLIIGEEKLMASLFKKADRQDVNHMDLVKKMWTVWLDMGDDILEKRKAAEFATILKGSNQFLRLCVEMSKHLADYRVKHGVLLNSDATNMLSELSKDHRDNPSFIWEKMGQRYQYFLIDEFQDTSKKQWNNFLPLLDNAISISKPGPLKNLIVGDVKQSIYRWRGGDWGLLEHQVSEDIGPHYIQNETLDYNYRSEANIIEFNNQVFEFLPKRLQETLNHIAEDQLGSENYESIWENKGYDKVIEEIYNPATTKQQIPAWKKEGLGQIDLIPIAVENNKDRFSRSKEAIFQKITEQLDEWIVKEQVYQPHQIGILVRTNKEAKELIEYVKEHNDNAYQLVSAEAFYLKEHTIVQFLVLLLEHLVALPEENSLNLLKLIQYHRAVIAELAQNEVVALHPEELALISKMKLSEAVDFLPREFCENYESLNGMPTMEVVEQLIATFEWGTHSSLIPYLIAFREEVANATIEEGASIDQFLTYWEVEQDKAMLPEGSKGNFIEVLTLHKSKGLAYDVVILPTLNWQMIVTGKSYYWWKAQAPVEDLKLFPIQFSLDHTPYFLEETAEEVLMQYVDALNGLYVAMTRAKKHMQLYLLQEGKTLNPGSYLIGDFINQFVREAILPTLKDEDAQDAFVAPVHLGKILENKAEEDIKSNSVVLDNYPVMHHFNMAYSNKETLDAELMDQLPAQQMGIWLHQMMEWYFESKDALELLNKACQQNQFPIDVAEQIKEVYQTTINNEVLASFKAYPKEHIMIEQTILSPDKKIFRPDMVWLNEEDKSAVILDFKFTKQKEKKHRTQVENYKRLLMMMGYLEVDAFLYYGLENQELIQVS